MNDILERIDDFLNEREEKEKYMIYLSIVIVFGIIYYYFNYNVLYKKLKEEKESLIAMKRSYDLRSHYQKLMYKKNIYVNIRKRIDSIRKDLEKIDYLIATTNHPELSVKEDEVFKFLKDLFNFSISKYLFPTYKIDSNLTNGLKLYRINIKGRTDIRNFNNFISFLRFMEKSNFVTDFSRVEFNLSIYGKRKMSDYNATLDIWSYK